MRGPFAPVQAGTGESPPRMPSSSNIDTDGGKEFLPATGDFKVIAGTRKAAPPNQSRQEIHSEPSCDVVITKSR